MEAGRELGIEPLLTAAEIEQERTEHLGIMAQTARLSGVHVGSSRSYGAPSTFVVHTSHNYSHYNGYSSDHTLPHKVRCSLRTTVTHMPKLQALVYDILLLVTP